MSNNEWSKRFERVTSYIKKNLAELGSPREVAGIVDVSYETLRKRFRREKRMPLGKFIRQMRVDEARRGIPQLNTKITHLESSP